jgi:carboxymethylenebutenolidase
VVDKVRQPVLLLHGECDSLSPVAGMRELQAAFTKAGGEAEIHTYSDADHGFAVSTHKGYKAEAASDGFGRAVAFLGKHLGGKP